MGLQWDARSLRGVGSSLQEVAAHQELLEHGAFAFINSAFRASCKKRYQGMDGEAEVSSHLLVLFHA